MRDRFAHDVQSLRAASYEQYRGPFWPPADGYQLISLDLAASIPSKHEDFLALLGELDALVRVEWEHAKRFGVPSRTRFSRPELLAATLRKVTPFLSCEQDRAALGLRADAVERGYNEPLLRDLAALKERVSLVVGQIATWYGKQTGGLPTAFGCVSNETCQARVKQGVANLDEVRASLLQLHAGLELRDPPVFAACDLFFMTGEGNLHPKHIAYFLPEDEGIKRSPFKKTYYFSNTHEALVRGVSAPLFARHANLGNPFDIEAAVAHAIPTLGVFTHEIGHFISRAHGSLSRVNRENRWASVVLQEVSADVFGTLILAEILSEPLGLDSIQVVAYYIAECLRYVDRGLGYFPDSDGMLMQLNYLVMVGALRVEQCSTVRLVGDAEAVLAAIRSFARILADTLLVGDTERTFALYRRFGPLNSSPLRALVDELRLGDLKSIEYVQEHVRFDYPAKRADQQSLRGDRLVNAAVGRPNQDLDSVREYYTQMRDVDGNSASIYEIWENGGAFEDSVTPSTYTAEYRSHLVLKILSLTAVGSIIFSIGCGNAVVEGEVVTFGRRAQAIDCNEEAVRLACLKGVEAFQADLFDLPSDALANADAIYADGLLGHVFDPVQELNPFLAKLKSMTLRAGTWLVFSNDSPRDMTLSFSPHDRLRDFWFVSRHYLEESLLRAGFNVSESYYFPYVRPVSGLRNRTICVAQVR